MVGQSSVSPDAHNVAYRSPVVSEGQITPDAGVFPPALPDNVPSSQTREEGTGNSGAHVAAWKKDEVHEIPKNNLPVG